jgi:MFS family permease
MSAPAPGAPRTSRRRALVTVVVGLSMAGVLIGGLWAWIAPTAHGVQALTRDGDRVHDYLGDESEHLFVAAFLMLGLLTVVAVVAATLVWQWRAHRGPAMVAGLCLGVLGAAAGAAGVGALLVHLHYGAVDFAAAPLTHDDPIGYFAEAPPVFFGHTRPQIACTLLLPVATAALVYGVAVAATARDDLGGYPAVERPAPPVPEPVTADGDAPSCR